LGLLSATSEVSVDSTGLENHYVSRYFLDRRARPGRTRRHRRWVKLTAVVDHRSHLILSAIVGRGPSNDAPGFLPAVGQAVERVRIRRLFGDGAYDAEEHHRRCREDWKIRETIIPVNTRGHPKTRARGPYRRALQRAFPAEKYGRRWHAESVFSQTKRRLTPHLRSRKDDSRTNECLLLVVTHNLMLLARWRKKLSTEHCQ
jgi:hypothetical protein